MESQEDVFASRAGLTRRQFVVRMGAGSALLAAGSVGLAPLRAHAARAAAQPLNVVWTNVALPPNIDPAIGFDSDTLMLVRNVYEGLLEYVPGGTTVRPGLAKSYTVSPDGLTYTFNLRNGVVFHDGTKFDAAAAVASLNRIREINQGPATLLVNVKSFEAKGPSTVVVHMSAPYAFLPGVMPWLPIVSPAALAAHSTKADPHAEKWFASNAVGTGPYMLSSFNPNSKIDVVQNVHYWQPWKPGTPTSGSLTLNANVTTQLELLQAGQVDFLGAISPDNAEAAQKLSNVVLLVQPGLEVQTMPLNITKKPLDNPKVRQALIKAFDYDAFLKFNKGFGQMANSPLPPGLPGYDASLPMPKQDLTAAKQLLEAAGVPSGTTMSFVGVQGLDYESYAGLLMQTALAKLGIKLNVTTPPWPVPATIMSKPSTAAHITFLNVSANTNDPSAVIREQYASSNIASKGGYNWAYYENSQIDSDLAKFASAKPAAQKQLITGMQKQIVDDAVGIYALAPKLTEPVAKKWRNSKYDALFNVNVVRWFYTQAVA
jgi:peptide/nickel transport system substrate-binding protein